MLSTTEASLFERPAGGERSALVNIDSGNGDASEVAREFQSLAISAGASVSHSVMVRRQAPDSRYFIGTGKVEQLAGLVGENGIDLVVVNHALSPAQERNLERALRCRVLDRTGLILDIFAQRARSFEGKLQVELAQLRHIASRLVRGWSHLERQKGGIGLRGPGETQLETDRRLLGVRIKQIERRLIKVRRQREQGRQARKKRELPVVSLVGYTNAGKSTLFNRLTEAEVYAANQLFATLDTTLRRVDLPNAESAIFSDTVGFIRDLPHQLVAAFRSTLEEVTAADLLVHVIDAADEARDEHRHHVDDVLAEIGAEAMPRLLVFNKIDRLGVEPRIVRDSEGLPEAVWLSAVAGEGLELLLQAVSERLASDHVHGWITLPPARAKLRARFFQLGQVLNERITESGASVLEVDLPRRDLDRLYRKEGLTEAVQDAMPA